MFQRNKRLLAIAACLVASISNAHESHQHGDNNQAKKTQQQLKQQTGISISEQWIRSSAPGAPTTAAYFVLNNHSRNDIALIDVKSDIAQQVEIHEHSMEDGLMKMQQTLNVALPKQSTVMFEPGGYHIMFIGLKKSVNTGDKIKLTLTFDNNTEQTITVIAKKKANKKKGEHHGQH